ncbi:hypothetical protein [Streptomyces sp. NPDC002825]|uniref:hypothetical protein n=1 Tax=Streptomyces sp. NPDC002825 TaxID=3154666 RepID=UPI003320508A
MERRPGAVAQTETAEDERRHQLPAGAAPALFPPPVTVLHRRHSHVTGRAGELAFVVNLGAVTTERDRWGSRLRLRPAGDVERTAALGASTCTAVNP